MIGRSKQNVTARLIDATLKQRDNFTIKLRETRNTVVINSIKKKKKQPKTDSHIHRSPHRKNTRTVSGAKPVYDEANHKRAFFLFQAMARHKVISALV